MNKNLLQIHAKSFYWASFFLSKKIFYQCSVLYNFCRTLDDIVDSEKQLEIRKKEFSNFKNDFLNKNLNNQIIKEMWDLINSQNISKIVVLDLFNGVETDLFHPDLPTPYLKGNPKLLFAGNLLPSKNVITLISAMKHILKKYPNAYLEIVGNGSEYENLNKKIKQLNLEKNIELVGQLNRNEIKFRFSSCDIFISSSIAEQHSITAFEAMACGKPVLLSNIPPFREVISDSKTGLLFSPYDEVDIANKVEELFENYEKFQIYTRTWAETYSWNSSAKQVAKIYDELI